jgi:murein peptide amidase A
MRNGLDIAPGKRTFASIGANRWMVCLFAATSFFATTDSVAAPKKAAVQTEPSVVTYVEQCRALAARLKLSAREVCETGSDASEPLAMSHGERPIFQRSSGVDPETENAIRVLIIGAIHGDETTAGWLALQWANWQPPHVVGTQFAVRHIPIANPDGAFTKKTSRTNARGVDLNRNFPTPKWQTEAPKWWQGTARRDPRRFPGNTAASEFETRAIIAAIESFKPSVIVAIHAPLGVLDYDGGGLPPERIGSIWLDVVGIYPGSLGHYASRVHGIPVLTVELPNALKMVSEQESKRMWTDLFAWVKKYSQHDSTTK